MANVKVQSEYSPAANKKYDANVTTYSAPDTRTRNSDMGNGVSEISVSQYPESTDISIGLSGDSDKRMRSIASARATLLAAGFKPDAINVGTDNRYLTVSSVSAQQLVKVPSLLVDNAAASQVAGMEFKRMATMPSGFGTMSTTTATINDPVINGSVNPKSPTWLNAEFSQWPITSLQEDSQITSGDRSFFSTKMYTDADYAQHAQQALQAAGIKSTLLTARASADKADKTRVTTGLSADAPADQVAGALQKAGLMPDAMAKEIAQKAEAIHPGQAEINAAILRDGKKFTAEQSTQQTTPAKKEAKAEPETAPAKPARSVASRRRSEGGFVTMPWADSFAGDTHTTSAPAAHAVISDPQAAHQSTMGGTINTIMAARNVMHTTGTERKINEANLAVSAAGTATDAAHALGYLKDARMIGGHLGVLGTMINSGDAVYHISEAPTTEAKVRVGMEAGPQIVTGIALTTGTTGAAIVATATTAGAATTTALGGGGLAVATGTAVALAVPLAVATGASYDVYAVVEGGERVHDTNKLYNQMDEQAKNVTPTQKLGYLKALSESGSIHKELVAQGATFNGKHLDLENPKNRELLAGMLKDKETDIQQGMHNKESLMDHAVDMVLPMVSPVLAIRHEITQHYNAKADIADGAMDLAFVQAAQKELSHVNDMHATINSAGSTLAKADATLDASTHVAATSQHTIAALTKATPLNRG